MQSRAEKSLVWRRWLAQQVQPQLLVPHVFVSSASVAETQTLLVNLISSPSILPGQKDKGTDDDDNDEGEGLRLPSSYSRLFLKLLIQKLEAQSYELEDCLTEYYANLLVSSYSSQFSTSNDSNQLQLLAYPTLSLQKEISLENQTAPYVLIHETPNIISANGSTGHRTWEAALALSDYILSSSDSSPLFPSSSFSPSTIIELGAGTGLTGLEAAFHFSANTLILTDGDDDVVRGLEKNIEKNKKGLDISKQINNNTSNQSTLKYQTTAVAEKLWWGNDSDFNKIKSIIENSSSLSCSKNSELLVLAADVTYDAEAAPALISCVGQFLSTSFAANGSSMMSVKILLAATMRSIPTFTAFQNSCEEQGLEMTLLKEYTQPYVSEYFYWSPSSSDVRIYQIEKKNQLNK